MPPQADDHSSEAATARRMRPRRKKTAAPDKPGPKPSLPVPAKPTPSASLQQWDQGLRPRPVRVYELVVILDPELEERTVLPSLDGYLDIVRDDGGSVQKIDVWGRRRLAYSIAKRSEAIYAVVSLRAEPETVQELDRRLTLNDDVLRTKVIRP